MSCTHPDDGLDVNLDTLLSLLRERVSPKWCDFGEALGIDEMVLDSITTTCSPETCFATLLHGALEGVGRLLLEVVLIAWLPHCRQELM